MENKRSLEQSFRNGIIGIFMIFMACTTCKRVVQSNATGTCLGCQRGFVAEPQEDSYEHYKQEENNALQKPESEEVFLRKSPTTREKVRKRNEKRKKVTSKGKKN